MVNIDELPKKQVQYFTREILGHAQIKKPCTYAELISLNLSAKACDYCPFRLGSCIMHEFTYPSFNIIERLLK